MLKGVAESHYVRVQESPEGPPRPSPSLAPPLVPEQPNPFEKSSSSSSLFRPPTNDPAGSLARSPSLPPSQSSSALAGPPTRPPRPQTSPLQPAPSATFPATVTPLAQAPSSLGLRACYFLLGAGLLAAWNALITATDYFQAVYPGWHTDRLFTLCYLPLCMLMLALGLRYPDFPSAPARIRIGYTGFTVAMAAVPLLDALLVEPAAAAAASGGGDAGGASARPSSSGAAPTAALAAVLACVALVGTCDGLCQGALFGEAAQLPQPYMHALVSGTASSGLLVCLLRIVSKAYFEAVAAGEDGPTGGGPGTAADAAAAEARRASREAGLRDGTRLYFALGGLLSLSCLAVYDIILPRLRPSPWSSKARRDPDAASAAAATSIAKLNATANAPYRITGLVGTAATATASAAATVGTVVGFAKPAGGDHESQPLLQSPPLELSRGVGSGSGSGSGPYGVVAVAAAATVTGSVVPTTATADATATSTSDGAGLSVGIPAALSPLPRVDGPQPSSWPGPGPGHGTARASGWLSAVLRPQVRRCLGLSWQLCGSLVVTYTVTLSIFPGFLAEDVHSAELGDWYPILLITAFNAADLIGKSLPCLEPLPPPTDPGKPCLPPMIRPRLHPHPAPSTQPWQPSGPQRGAAGAWAPVLAPQPQPGLNHLQINGGQVHGGQAYLCYGEEVAGPGPSPGSESGSGSGSGGRASRSPGYGYGRKGQLVADHSDDHHHHHHHNPEAPLLAGRALRRGTGPAEHSRIGALLSRWSRWLCGRGGSCCGRGGGGGVDGYCRRLLGALAAPLRRPGGLLAASLVRGAAALPAFVLAALWGAPAGVMAALTAALGVSNGYLTSQALTVGPSAVLKRPPEPSSSPPQSVPPSSPPSPRTPIPVSPYIGHANGGFEALPITASGISSAGSLPLGSQPSFRDVVAGGVPAVGSGGVGTAAAAAVTNAGSAARVPELKIDTGRAQGQVSAPGPTTWPRRGAAEEMPGGRGVRAHEGLGGVREGSEEAAELGAAQDQWNAMDAGQEFEFGSGTHGPLLPGHSDAEVVENLLVLSLVAGLNLGAYLGWLWLL